VGGMADYFGVGGLSKKARQRRRKREEKQRAEEAAAAKHARKKAKYARRDGGGGGLGALFSAPEPATEPPTRGSRAHLCRDFRAGRCARGAACRFQHVAAKRGRR